MSIEKPEQEAGEVDPLSEKQRRWDEIAKLAGTEWGDSLGKGIDKGIRDVVVSFNVMDIPTSASCEGHVDGGLPYPWVEVEAEGQPEARFEHEREIAERIASERGVDIERILRSDDKDGWVQWEKERSKQPETEAFREWRKKQSALVSIVENLLSEFYANRSVEGDEHLRCDAGPESARVENGGEEDIPFFRLTDVTEELLKRRKERLERFQKEMHDFGEFLKKKYFEE